MLADRPKIDNSGCVGRVKVVIMQTSHHPSHQRDANSPRVVKGWNRPITVLLSLLLCLVYHDIILHSSNNQIDYTFAPPISSSIDRRKQLADGCYNVFIDAGSNIGVQ